MNQRIFRGDWLSHEVPTALQEAGQLGLIVWRKYKRDLGKVVVVLNGV